LSAVDVIGVSAGATSALELAIRHPEFFDSMFPLTPRVAGVLFDAFVSNAAVNDCGLEVITADARAPHQGRQLASHDASKRAADRIPGARFVSLESGGHLMLGQSKVVHDQLSALFENRSLADPLGDATTAAQAADS
jgi:pimeloyl-ACP methyl ester carboxylesterase